MFSESNWQRPLTRFEDGYRLVKGKRNGQGWYRFQLFERQDGKMRLIKRTWLPREASAFLMHLEAV